MPKQRQGLVARGGGLISGRRPAPGARKEEVLAAAEWLLEVKQLPGDVLYLKALDVPFSSTEGHEAELQNKLRALLFPRSVESPA